MKGVLLSRWYAEIRGCTVNVGLRDVRSNRGVESLCAGHVSTGEVLFGVYFSLEQRQARRYA